MLPEGGALLGLWRMGLPGLDVGMWLQEEMRRCNETKLLTSHKAYCHACDRYLDWVEPVLYPVPVVSGQDRILSRHSWHQKTS